MGILDVFRRNAPAPAPPAKVLPATVAQGVPGDANFGGRLAVEPNAALRDQSAFGRAGTFSFGEWDDIVRSNPFVAAGLDFVLGPIRDARLDVEEPSPEALPDEAQRKAITDFVRWNLAEKLPLSQVAAAAAHGFLGSGFSLFEPIFEVTKHHLLPGGTGFALKAVPERLPNSLHPNPWQESDEGRLVAVRQHGPRGMGGAWLTVDLPVERLLLFSWQRKGNNWQGRSAFRAVWYIAGRVMPELLRLIGVTLQREGAGIPIASAADASTPLTPEQRTQLVELLSGLVYHEGASAVLPAGWKLDWVFSGGSNKGHVLEVWQQLGVVVLQQVGAQQLALGTGETGSRSVGETHDARAMAYVRSVVGYVENVINGVDSACPSLVERLVVPNWGPLAAYPKVKLTLKRPELDPKTRMEALGLAKAAGLLTVTAKDENHVREELGLSPLDEEERAAAKALQPAPPPSPFGAPPAQQPPEASMQASAPRTQWRPWRPLRASEQRLKLSDIDAYYVAARSEFERKVKPVVVGMLAVAAPSISEAMKDGNPSEVATLPLDTEALDAAVREYLASVREAGARFVREELLGGRPLSAAQEEQDDKDRPASVVTEEADDVLDAQAKALQRRMVARLRGEVEREAIDVLQRGGTAGDVVRRTVARQLETGAFKADAGTVTARAFSVGREEAAELLGGVAQVEYSAILDSGTCDPCRSADGTVVDYGSPEHDALLPPNRDCEGGDNCRCLLVFIPEAKR